MVLANYTNWYYTNSGKYSTKTAFLWKITNSLSDFNRYNQQNLTTISLTSPI